MVRMLLRILFPRMCGAVFQKLLLLGHFHWNKKPENFQWRGSSALTQFTKECDSKKALRKGKRNHWDLVLASVLLQLSDYCIRTRRSMLKCIHFPLSRFLQEPPHSWHQMTVTQGDIVNKEATEPKLYFPTGLYCSLSAVIFAWTWQLIIGEHMLLVSLDLAALKLRAKLTVIAF